MRKHINFKIIEKRGNGHLNYEETDLKFEDTDF